MATTESRRIGANTPAPSSWVIIRRLKYPSPLCAPSHSPIAAPMMDSGTAILMAEKKQGSTAGIFNLKKIWRLSAPNVNSSSSISVFTDLNPSNTVIVIGKNVINIPRKVHYSRELIKKMNKEFPKELCDLIKLFVDGGFGFSTAKVKGSDAANSWNIGLKPGLAIKLSDRFCLVAKYGFLGYSQDETPMGTKTKNFGLDLDTDELSFGFHYIF